MFFITKRGFLRGVLLVMLLPLLLGCGPEQQIIAEWQNGDDMIEFFEDGTFSGTYEGIPFTGDYKFVDENRMKVTFSNTIIEMLLGSQVVKVDIHENELTLIFSQLALEYRKVPQ